MQTRIRCHADQEHCFQMTVESFLSGVQPGVVVLVEMGEVVQVGQHKVHVRAPLLQTQLKDLECNALVLH